MTETYSNKRDNLINSLDILINDNSVSITGIVLLNEMKNTLIERF